MRLVVNPNDICRIIGERIYPVVEVDISNIDERGIIGPNVFIRDKNFGFVRGRLIIPKGGYFLRIVVDCSEVSGGFSYEDMKGLMDCAKSPVIRPDSQFLIVFTDTATRKCTKPVVVQTGRFMGLSSEMVELEQWNVLDFLINTRLLDEGWCRRWEKYRYQTTSKLF